MVPKIDRRVGGSGVSNTHHSARVGHKSLRGGAIAATLASMAALSLSAIPADAAVTGGESIEVFTGSNLISLTGYPATTEVRVEVLRQGIVIGHAVKTTDADGVIEMNHIGAEADDCFDPPSSPDVMPRDTIRTTVLANPANQDTSVVRGVWIDDIQYGLTTITVSGRVTRGAGPAAVRPGVDVLELRINKDTVWDVNDRPNRRDRREDIGASVNPDGTWTHVINASADDVAEAEAGSETFLEWSAAAGETEEFPPELTVAEFGPGEALPGCPPLQRGPTAPALLAADNSGKKRDHITNVATNLTFRGLAGPDVEDATVEPGANAEVQLKIDNGAFRPVGNAGGNAVYQFDVASLTQGRHRLTVRTRDAGGAFFSAQRVVRVDTSIPSATLRTLAPKPLHLAGPERLRAVYRVSEAAALKAKVQKLSPSRTVKTFAVRNTRSARRVEYFWNGRNETRRNVRPGAYRILLTVMDAAGNQSTERVRFRVVR